ncbi:MAG: hypothetical protein ACYDCO_15835 [Armatimonadota bacterium]
MLGLTLAAWSFVEVDRPFATVHTTGSLQLVNAGQVSPWDLQGVDPAGMVGGLGTGTLKKYFATGEMLSFFGRTFIRTTNPKGGVQVVEVSEPFRSPFSLMIKQVPGQLKLSTGELAEVFPRTYRLIGNETQLLHTVLEKLAVEANSPIAVIGWAEMSEVDGSALKKAPIGDQPLHGDKKAEILDDIRATDAHMVFFAVVSPMLAISKPANTVLMGQAYDYDPEQGQPAAALIHAHGALVNEPLPIPDAITAPIMIERLQTVTVNDILHVYGTSSVTKAAFLVYRLEYPKPAKKVW